MITIRPYAAADWDAVCHVHDRARPHELAGATDPRAFRPMAAVADAEHFFDSVTLVACEGKRIVGFVSVMGSYITWLYVEPERHRRGIGAALLAAALKLCGRDAWLNTLEGNAAALALYRKAGFDIVKSFSSNCDGYPCVCLRLALPTSRMHDPDVQAEL